MCSSDFHELVAAGERKRLEKHRRRQRIDQGIRANSEGERRDARDRVDRMARQRPKAESNVAIETIEHERLSTSDSVIITRVAGTVSMASRDSLDQSNVP